MKSAVLVMLAMILLNPLFPYLMSTASVEGEKKASEGNRTEEIAATHIDR